MIEDKWLKGPGFRQSARETDGGRKGDLVGGISLVGYRGCRREVSYEKKKSKQKQINECKKKALDRKQSACHAPFLHFIGLDN